MPEYLSPGVYVEEVPPAARPIEGVSTSTAGFVGRTERGPTAVQLITSWPEYQRWYGDYVDPTESYLPYAVKGFFDNGGQRLFLARVVGANAQPASINLATTDGQQTLVLTAAGPGEWGDRIWVWVRPGSSRDPQGNPIGFRITVIYYQTAPAQFVNPLEPDNVSDPNRREPDRVEDFDNLSADPAGPNYVLTILEGSSTLVRGAWGDTTRPGAAAQPTPDFAQMGNSQPGAAIGPPDYVGTGAGDDTIPSTDRTGLAALEMIDEVSLLCVPDDTRVGGNVTAEMLNQCQRLKDRFAILQVPAGTGNVTGIDVVQDTSYGAIYYPWINVYDPRRQRVVLVPPGGHVAGVYARTDIERGVHKAPANEDVRGIILRDMNGQMPLEFRVTKGQHDILNPRGINVIRDFRADGRGIRVWGARTMSSDPQWRYVNVRRLFLYLEESIDEGTQWVVFEPNDEPLWAQVRRTLTNFLVRVWRSGALMGVTQEEAFFVKCDRTTMTQDDIDNGRLICYIGVAPVKPAEFVIFRISQKTAEAAA